MIKEQVSIDEVIALLNEALNLDRKAISKLCATRVSCNEELAVHKTIQVGAVTIPTNNHHVIEYEMGILGILNGLFGIRDDNGWGAIVAIIEDDPYEWDYPEVIRFERTPEKARRIQT